MSFEARVLYTFESVSDEELGVIEGEFVTVVDTTLGNGWCLVRNKQGLEGIVPESYVEKVSGECFDERVAKNNFSFCFLPFISYLFALTIHNGKPL